MSDVEAVVETILDRRPQSPADESMLIAIGGIDGSGKGYVTARILAELQRRGVRDEEQRTPPSSNDIFATGQEPGEVSAAVIPIVFRPVQIRDG